MHIQDWQQLRLKCVLHTPVHIATAAATANGSALAQQMLSIMLLMNLGL